MLAASPAFARGAVSGGTGNNTPGPATPMPQTSCGWPAYADCGDTNADMVDMTCHAAQAAVKASGWLATKSAILGPIAATKTCGMNSSEPYWVRTRDGVCVVGTYCVDGKKAGKRNS